MAFGLDIQEFRNIFVSISSLLRMVVGDFDYKALEGSQLVLGPVLFWVYIFLMIFVLLSMFIALISEAYDSIRQDNDTLITPRLNKGSYPNMRRVTAEADKRLTLSQELKMTSNKLFSDLKPFRDALEGDFKKLSEQEELEEQDSKNAASGPNIFKRMFAKIAPLDGDQSTGTFGRVVNYFRTEHYWDEKEISGVGKRDGGIKYRAIQSLSPGDPTYREFEFEFGDIIVVTERSEGGWWTGYLERTGPDELGRFAAKLVEPVAHQPGEAALDLSDDEDDLVVTDELDDDATAITAITAGSTSRPVSRPSSASGRPGSAGDGESSRDIRMLKKQLDNLVPVMNSIEQRQRDMMDVIEDRHQAMMETVEESSMRANAALVKAAVAQAEFTTTVMAEQTSSSQRQEDLAITLQRTARALEGLIPPTARSLSILQVVEAQVVPQAGEILKRIGKLDDTVTPDARQSLALLKAQHSIASQAKTDQADLIKEFGKLQTVVKMYHTELFSSSRGAHREADPFPPGMVGGGGYDHTMYDHPSDASVRHPDDTSSMASSPRGGGFDFIPEDDDSAHGSMQTQPPPAPSLGALRLAASQSDQPGGTWRRMFNNRAQMPYWFNMATGKTSWVAPPGVDPHMPTGVQSRPGSASSSRSVLPASRPGSAAARRPPSATSSRGSLGGP